MPVRSAPRNTVRKYFDVRVVPITFRVAEQPQAGDRIAHPRDRVVQASKGQRLKSSLQDEG
jgi:hypothetical protein